MYHAVIRERGEVVSERLVEALGEAVAYAEEEGAEGNLVQVFEALQDASGDILHLAISLSFYLKGERQRM
jgi:hypothetical protein